MERKSTFGARSQFMSVLHQELAQAGFMNG